ncbi:hypothetical protein PIB30_002394 [Stylosanthes scabra]|uniref:Uncharacterized protein n=1 Tax=Stylosanthes scabra TaxID=79078 RepID=A0ABU6V3U2_9FABA|nr:hypothetical protein [Stylosanthes scabra]
MACLEMYNSDQHHHKGHNHHHHVSPRISFSNDFVDVQQAMKQQQERATSSRSEAASSDFEFSVTNYSMMSADELFFKGRLLPYKDNNKPQRAPTTLREELLLHDDDDDDSAFSLRPPKSSSSSTRWKGFLGLRKTNIASSKKGGDKPDLSSEPTRPSLFLNQGSPSINLTSQDVMMNEGGSSSTDLEEIGI